LAGQILGRKEPNRIIRVEDKPSFSAEIALLIEEGKRKRDLHIDGVRVIDTFAIE